MPQPIHPTAAYDASEVAELLHVGERTVNRWPLRWIYLGTRTRRVLGADLLTFLESKAA